MKKRVHELTLEEAFRSAGGQPWRREAEVVPEHIREAEEIDAARAWLRHVEAGRIGTRSHAGVHGEHDDAKLG